jgi:cytochrome c biogenesis protein CcdA
MNSNSMVSKDQIGKEGNQMSRAYGQSRGLANPTPWMSAQRASASWDILLASLHFVLSFVLSFVLTGRDVSGIVLEAWADEEN